MIYPKVQKNNLNGEIVSVNAVAFSGDCKTLAERVFKENNIDTNGDFQIEIKLSDTRRTTYIEELSRLSVEISLTSQKILSSIKFV